MDEQLRAHVKQGRVIAANTADCPKRHCVSFHVDHIIAEQHGGSDELPNLALCCSRCNFSKGPNLSGIDCETGAIVTLFHPGKDERHDHFEYQGALILGRTPTGRSTVQVLNMNEDRRVKLRASLLQTRRPRRKL